MNTNPYSCRCFNCAHDTCGLAGKTIGFDIDLAQCNLLNCSAQGGSLRVSKGSKDKGGFKVACTRKECGRAPWWLPSFITAGT